MVSDGLITPDWPAAKDIVAGTALRTAGADAIPEGVRFLHQVHGATVVTAGQVRSAEGPLDADAVFGNEAGDICAVRTADCLPVLFCSADGETIAAAHAGWRGLASGVLENTVRAMQRPAGDILAWLGPAISQANFEVGSEVRDAFLKHNSVAESCFELNDRGRWQADLYGLARQRLHRCGVEAIYGGGLCTYADEQRFYSYRRNRTQERMISFIGRHASGASSLTQALK